MAPVNKTKITTPTKVKSTKKTNKDDRKIFVLDTSVILHDHNAIMSF